MAADEAKKFANVDTQAIDNVESGLKTVRCNLKILTQMLWIIVMYIAVLMKLWMA